MADGMNKAILIGNLGADPELSYTQSNQAVLKLRLATNESFMNKAGERQERTEWHRIVIWGKRGEGLSKVLSKGSQLGIEGRIQTREWQDKDGNRRWTTEIVANQVYLLGGRGRGGGGGGDQEPPAPSDSNGPGGFEGGDEDIPF